MGVRARRVRFSARGSEVYVSLRLCLKFGAQLFEMRGFLSKREGPLLDTRVPSVLKAHLQWGL